MIPPILTKGTITFHFNSMNIQKITTYDFGNPGHGVGQTQKCDRVKLVNGIPTLPS